ncbi:Diadenosine 5',5'''-P1,P4-tetraphosphate phosphorylase 2 [Hypsizygus marmoreus]|uniref:Diadenosine 5',5'''-P1,P4-tetraphosphate phosphorylase 2 n=1 Tax=Hypsizygus marmoreus TaxID=39966 RepID=A0A369K1W8_HYPMA|nr:Diadenosine 5',5'''-P1,P4-tetraphosphate phosphorylase 2 [Hypsizygus marmoreus]
MKEKHHVFSLSPIPTGGLECGMASLCCAFRLICLLPTTMSPHDIIALISESFNKARNSGDLFFFPSTLTRHTDAGIEFEIKLCPALQKKPQLPTPDLEADPSAKADLTVPNEKKLVDPFTPPFNPNLHIGDLCDEDGEEYVVLLNKYALVAEHFLLVTKEFRSQSSPLMPSELVQAYLLLAAARKSGRNFFAFYNCGDNSGASQPHKHVQFIPVDEDGPPVEQLARAANLEVHDKPFSLTVLPYANHVYRFPSRLSSYNPDRLEYILSTAFLSLLDLGVSTIRHDPEYPAGRPSYNVLITLEHMHLIPRRRESYTIQQTGEALSVNALGFAGMVLVKSDEELEAVKKEGLGKILRSVGLESVHDIQVAGSSSEA